MKKKWMKKLIAFAATTAMMIGCLGVTANAAATVTNVNDDYLKGLVGGAATGKAEITITKYQDSVNNPEPSQSAKPIEGVTFGIVNVGTIAQYKDGTESGMAYGIKTGLLNIINSKGGSITADYTSGEYSYVKDYTKIHAELKKVPVDELEKYSGLVEKTTGTEGTVVWGDLKYGLYLVVETDASGAKVEGKPITIAKRQYPYIVSAPIYDEKNKIWTETIRANAKNETGTASLEKDIVRDYTDPTAAAGPISGETLKDTDVTNIGDRVEFKLTSDVIALEANREFDSYVIEDRIFKGLTLPTTTEWSDNNIKVVDVKSDSGITFALGTDYTVETDVTVDTTVTVPTIPADDSTDFRVTFTKAGLGKLAQIATATDRTDANRKIALYYTAIVNSDAVVGKDGNPNESRLVFKVEGNPTITTSWDKVIEYIFSMKANKVFNGNPGDANQIGAVTFTLNTKNAAGELVPVSVTGENGVYNYATSGGTSTIALKDDGTLSIKGVPTDVKLYLKETATAAGFNLLSEPIELELVASETATGEKGAEYNGYLNQEDTTVNGEKVENLGNEAVSVSVTVNNISGFQLPSTGGMGAWLFAIAGVLVIAGGVVFFARTKRS